MEECARCPHELARVRASLTRMPAFLDVHGKNVRPMRANAIGDEGVKVLTRRLTVGLKAFLVGWTLLRAVDGVAQVLPAPTTLQQEKEVCRAEKVALGTTMASVFHEFDTARDPVPLETLVSVDGRIRGLLRAVAAEGPSPARCPGLLPARVAARPRGSARPDIP